MVDVSSYNRPEPSLLDNVQKFQAVENNRLQISQQKLDQANQANSYMIRAMGSLGPNASKEQHQTEQIFINGSCLVRWT